ncbi:uncharacterized protein M8220_017821 [Acridotheres tristis]
MDRQAAYELFISNLEKRGVKEINLKKDLIGLLAWGYMKGVFLNPHSIHELSEWRSLGDKLWEAVLEDDKTAKKLGKIWRVVHNALLKEQAEKRAAQEAVEAYRRNAQYGSSDEPRAPSVSKVMIPVPGGAAGNEDPGDPLQGITVDELMGLGAFRRTEAQLLSGPDRVREAMRLVRHAINQVKDSSGIPMYMGIKQGRDETFGNFVDKAAAAIERAGVPEYMRGALLKQCALQNCNETTRRVLSTLGANWTIEEALERMALQPTGTQAFLVKAIQELGLGLQKQAESTQTQVLAALAPLRAFPAALATSGDRGPPSVRCYRCGGGGHVNISATSGLQPATTGSLGLDLAAAVKRR